jgi:hypothetical protein
MKQEQSKYQLRRMVLVNAGTNMHVPSGRITAIDPRGGAAVLGDNGVGKTTTLRILPLFFGHLPSQIVAAGHGQEAMIRFVLPTDASAIAFEYQRGSDDEDDLRLAVIRRRGDDPDVPFYRLYRSGFRKEFFVEEGRFLSDDETQLRATALGVMTSSKLTTAEYRSVILRTPAASKEKDRLRRYSVEWSFGPKQLDNLDRVVAAMVKKHISFSDIVQVAVGLVQHDLGQGAERAKLTFKQGKAPIERWLRNREACADAFRLAPEFSELEQGLKDHRAAEARFRACRSDVNALKAARMQEAGEVKKALEAMAASRAQQVETENARRGELNKAASLAAQQATSTKSKFDEEFSQAQYFEAENAAGWERQVQELPVLKSSLQTVQEKVTAAESVATEAKAKYGELESGARKRTGELCLEQERSKELHRERLRDAQTQIAGAETEALKLCDEEAAARRQQIDELMEPLVEERGGWENRKKNPGASSEALAEADEAGKRLQQHMEQVHKALEAAAHAGGDERSARRAFELQEEVVRKARANLNEAQSRVVELQVRLNPEEGTFLAELRANPDDGWKRNLAKVINPDLLERDDLDPKAVEDAAQTVYGWQLNTGVIASPDWVDNTSVREAIEVAQECLGAAEARLQGQHELLETLSNKLRGAELAAQAALASLTVLNGQTEERKTQVAVARQRVESEKRNAVDTAVTELEKLKSAIDGLKNQRRSADAEHATSGAAIRGAHDKQRRSAEHLCNEALASIDANVKRLQNELAEAVLTITEQLNEHLSEAGVDVNRLANMRTEMDGLRAEVQKREDKLALVERWKRWLEAGGPARVETLRTAALKAAEASGTAAAKLSEFQLVMQRAGEQYQAAVSSQEKRQGSISDDLEVLSELDESFGDYLAVGESVIDPKASARDLRSKVRAVHAEISRLEEAITKRTSTLRQALTAKSNAVKELVELSLERDVCGGAVSRAAALCSCFKLIGPQVANDVNITLRTLLANIGAFQKAIQAYEREVAAFNRRLQEGLTEVRCFERVKDLRLDIVTNFDGLGFYKKLSRMEAVVRQHATEVGRDYTRELPPDDTARALGEFMSVLGADGNVEVNLSQHITLKGSVSDNGQHKEFKRASELEHISSEGLTSLVLITLMTALLNTIRGTEPVHVPWVTDEVGKFDPKNFRALMQRLRDNRIDVVTASPELGPAQQAMFAQRYLFEDRGRIREYRPLETVVGHEVSAAAEEVAQ